MNEKTVGPPEPQLTEGEQAVYRLWQELLVPSGFRTPAPRYWSQRTRQLVEAAAADLPKVEALFRRVAASHLAGAGWVDLLWVLRDGRERVEAGRYDLPVSPEASGRP